MEASHRVDISKCLSGREGRPEEREREINGGRETPAYLNPNSCTDMTGKPSPIIPFLLISATKPSQGLPETFNFSRRTGHTTLTRVISTGDKLFFALLTESQFIRKHITRILQSAQSRASIRIQSPKAAGQCFIPLYICDSTLILSDI